MYAHLPRNRGTETTNHQSRATSHCSCGYFPACLALPTVNCITLTGKESTEIGESLRSGSSPAEPQPEHGQRNECAHRIEQRIVNTRCPANHERLVNFIQQGIARGDEQRAESPHPAPAGLAAPQRAVQQQEKHKVLREMRALANDMMDVVVLTLRQPGNEPAQNRLEKPFRVIRGKR